MAEVFEEEETKFQRVNTEPNEESDAIRYQAVPVSFIGPLMAMFDSSRLPEIVCSTPRLPMNALISLVHDCVGWGSHRSSTGTCSTRTLSCAQQPPDVCLLVAVRPYATGPWISRQRRCAPSACWHCGLTTDLQRSPVIRRKCTKDCETG